MSLDAIKTFIQSIPQCAGAEIQAMRWSDDRTTNKRYIVIKPVGGARAELVRRPQYTLFVIGEKGAGFVSPQDMANAIVQASRDYSGAIVDVQCGEPVYMPTEDDRAVFEIAVSAITV